MSLQVWLPLNGDLRNQGLSNYNISILRGSIVFDNNGKIGKCFYANGVNTIKIENIIPDFYNYSGYSLCAWFYIESQNTSHSGSSIISAGNWNNQVLNLALSNWSTDHYTQLQVSGTSWNKIYNYTFNKNTWYHVVISSDGSKTYAYVNGVLIGNTQPGFLPTSIEGNNIAIGGATYYSGMQFFGKINDVRIYDHALSVKEIEEIAKGLVLHYKLDTNLNVLDNCYNYPNFNTASSNGGWSHWGPSGHAGTYSQNTDRQYIYNKTNTYSHCVDNTASATGKYYICYQSPAFAGGYRSLQFIIKEANGLPITETICCPGWNARNGGAPANKWTKIISLGDGFYLCQVNGLSQDGSNDLVSCSVQPGYKIYISEGYLENNREICSDIFNQNNLSVVYDSSGCGNNGTIVGSLETTTPSVRYNYTTKFNGTSYIYTTSPCAEVKTVSLWVKWDTIPSGQSVVFLDAKSHIGLGLMSTGILCITSGLGSGNTFSKANLVANIWYHFVVVNPGGTTDIPRKLYINGIEQTATSKTSNWTYSIDQTQIGKRSTTSDGFVGSLNDVRLYSSVLTLEQILELYNTSMSIDNNSNIHTRELVEV